MRSFSLYFAFAALVGVALAWAATSLDSQRVEDFYGLAQTEQTEINVNYPVEVQEILVAPGQTVRAGQVLMRVRRARPQERLVDQDFRIDELRAEERVEVQRIDSELEKLRGANALDRQALEQRIAALRTRSDYRTQLRGALGDTARRDAPYQPLTDEVARLEAQLTETQRAFEARERALLAERRLAGAPYASARERLGAEKAFEEAQAQLAYDVTAPADGVIGNVNAKLAEHKSSFSPLLIFYEPTPTQVRAYIHEDRTLDAEIGQRVRVASVSTEKQATEGRITGMGSRIVEIPSRLRRIPEVRTYGREVIVDIPATNAFLQNEKVQLAFANGDE